MQNDPTITPTPPGTPTQIFLRITHAEDGKVHGTLGCDGEETASPEAIALMEAVASHLAAFFIVRGEKEAADGALRLAQYLLRGKETAPAAPPPSLKISLDAYAYPESGKVNGVYDPEEPTPDNPVRRPFLIQSERFKGEWRWRPVIDVETGTIDGWPQGTAASIYDKPRDDCAVIVDGRDLNEGEYVPHFLSPGDQGHDEDYLVMDIGADGHIFGWNAEEAKAWISKRLKEVTAP